MISTIVILPNVLVVSLGIEDFPFTCAPMFGHYVGTETDLYVFKFVGVKDNSRVFIKAEENGRPESVFTRQFFSKVYGSTDTLSPFSSYLDDSPDKFNQRMNDFFIAYWTFLSRKKNKDFDQIDLILEKVSSTGKPLQSYLLGYFNTKDRKYYHSYSKEVN